MSKSAVCKDCGATRDRGGQHRVCQACYDKSYRQKPPVVCTECGNERKHYGKGLCKPCYMRAYAQTDRRKQAHRAQEQRRRTNRAEEVRAQDRQRNQSDQRREWRRLYRRAYYERRKTELQAYNREWMRKHREQMAHYGQIYRSRKAALPHSLTRTQWVEILEEYGHRCAYCGKEGKQFHKEHKIPVSRGGGYTRDNIVPACGSCNSRKSNKTPEEFAAYLSNLADREA